MKPLEMWGGVECTVNRVGDGYTTQLDRSGHDKRLGDLDRFAALGIRAIRYPILWERTAPDAYGEPDWRWPDERLSQLRRLGTVPIVGLMHHGSGPRHTNLLDQHFAVGLSSFAAAVATRYPWIDYWTPINEPLTTARFSCLYGVWYPHAQTDRAFVAAVLNQCKATVLAMRAIRAVNPKAKLVQTEDLGRTDGTEPLADTVAFYNARRWLAWDLICGHVNPEHALWKYLLASGAQLDVLNWFAVNPCPPDLLGINYYVTSDRWLDHRVERYPNNVPTRPAAAFVDIEAVRVMALSKPAIETLLEEAWDRYGIPIAITEAHIDAGREDQMRWLLEIWRAAQGARRGGIDVRAVTAWSLLGAFDWNCLLAASKGYYETGPFDIRSNPPRRTALATLISDLAAARPPSHPVAEGEGWWRRSDRFVCEPMAPRATVARLSAYREERLVGPMRPILISGANGMLGKAFATVCAERNLAFRLLSRAEMDIANVKSVANAMQRWRPWAVINAGGYACIDKAEADVERCYLENAVGAAVLAERCSALGTQLLTFSSDQVFNGDSERPWLESDGVAPLNALGRSKAAAERMVLDAFPEAMVVRGSAFFGPWDCKNFLARALDAMAFGTLFRAADDVRISPNYLPDFVNGCLDLLIDGEAGIWHLANDADVSWYEFAAMAGKAAGLSTSSLVACRSDLIFSAPRPRYGVLGSERATSLMPALAGAIGHFVQCRHDAARLVKRQEQLEDQSSGIAFDRP